jgi:hypothetical protein
MDPQTLSAYAAAAAAFAAATVAGIQFYVGYRQSKAALLAAQAAMMNAQNAGRHTIAGSRQNWINAVIETLSEYHSLLLMTGVGVPEPDPEDGKKLVALRTKLEILLNPDEADTVALVAATDKIRRGKTLEERVADSPEMVRIARKLLKAEWVRIKKELQ